MAPLIPIAVSLAQQFAPSVLRYFGVGESSAQVAKKVVDVAAKLTGTEKPEEMLAKLKADAELAHKFQVELLHADTELEKLYIGDVRDARARDVEVRKLTGGKNERADMMVIGAVVGMISCLLVLVFFRKEIPGEVVGIISTIAGIFGACLRDAFQFEFGSSRRERDKDTAIMKWVDES